MQISRNQINLVPKGPNGHLGPDVEAKRGRADRILVTKTEDGWAPVTEPPGELSRKELNENFAIWRDRKVEQKTGDWQYPIETVRELDGEIQSDEIYNFGLEGPHDNAVKASIDPVSGEWLDSGISLGTELVATDEGFAFSSATVSTSWNKSFSVEDLNGSLTEFANNDLNWQIPN